MANDAQRFCMIPWPDPVVACGRAMPIAHKGIIADIGISVTFGALTFKNGGNRVPILRGSPPILSSR